MSETQDTQNENNQNDGQPAAQAADQKDNAGLKLNGLFAFKQGMSSYATEDGDVLPVSVLKFDPWVVTQVKSGEKDGYVSVQLASGPKKAKRSCKADQRLKPAGFENGAYHIKEMRQDLPEGVQVGQKLDISSLSVGDEVKVTGYSKGKGFAGVMRRWNMAGGPASHGSGFSRTPGSSGNRTWPGRIMPGKKFPGHLGMEQVTVKSKVVDIIPEENIVILKGAVPGSRNTLLKLMKV